MTAGSCIAFGVKITLIGIFAQSWANFSSVFAILTEVPQGIGNNMLGFTTVSDSDGLYGSLDKMLSRFTEYGDAIGDNAGWVFGAMLGVVFYIIAALFAAVGAGIIAYASIMLTAMIVVAPFAITCSMFEATKSIFDAWSRSTIGYATIPIVTGVALGIIASAGEQIMLTIDGPEAVEEVSRILAFVTILFLSIGVMAAIPSVAQNISGAFGLASNAAGLSGLAREGMVRSSQVAAGGATRLATGKTPRELGHAASEGLKRASPVRLAQTPAQALATTKAVRAVTAGAATGGTAMAAGAVAQAARTGTGNRRGS